MICQLLIFFVISLISALWMMNNVCRAEEGFICEILEDPYSFWDQIPCPPPSNPQILFQVDYRRLLGEEDGLRIIFRIAKRCEIPVPEMLKSPARLGGNAIFTHCDSQCLNTIVISCLMFFIVMVIIVIYVIRLVLFNLRKGKSDRYM